MKSKTTTRLFLASGIAAAGFIILFFVITSMVIGSQVRNVCQNAMRSYAVSRTQNRADCVLALNTLLLDENRDFRARNEAIWALGQLGDTRAFTILARYYTGNIPNREPIEGTISQYELRKAIALTSGSLNITAFVWRHGY